MLTLWDLIEPVAKLLSPPKSVGPPPPKPRPAITIPPAPARAPDANGMPRRTLRANRRPSATERYESIARELLTTHNIRVRRWRKSSSGIAVIVQYRDGKVTRYIESPRPRGPLSMAIFLHEVGHHVLGVGTIEPRCLEEYHAWMFALREMEARGLNITDGVRRRVHRSLTYAVRKAQRRGIRRLPAELAAYA